MVVLRRGGVAEEEEGEEALVQAEVWSNFINACALCGGGFNFRS